MRHATFPTIVEAFEQWADVDEGGGWWMLSFTDDARPVGDQHLGTCLVKAASAELAVTATHMTGLNPGGQVLIVGPVPEEDVPAEQPRWALMSRAEVEAVDRETGF